MFGKDDLTCKRAICIYDKKNGIEQMISIGIDIEVGDNILTILKEELSSVNNYINTLEEYEKLREPYVETNIMDVV